MKYRDIRDMDCCWSGDGSVHESMMRSYHIVTKLRWLMEQNTSNAVMLELLDLMEGRDV